MGPPKSLLLLIIERHLWPAVAAFAVVLFVVVCAGLTIYYTFCSDIDDTKDILRLWLSVLGLVSGMALSDFEWVRYGD